MRGRYIVVLLAGLACGGPAATVTRELEATPVAREVEPEPEPVLTSFVRGLLDDGELRACLGRPERPREHYFRLGFRRIEYEGRGYDQLDLESLVGDYDAQNCLNRRIAQVPQPAPVYDDALLFVLVDDPARPALGYREMRTSAGVPWPGAFRLDLVGGSLGGAGFRDGVAMEARFDLPLGLAADARGHLFVGDAENRAIREIDPLTGRVSTVVAVPQYEPVVIAGRERRVERNNLTQPTSLAFDARGRLHALDALKGEVWRIEDGAATRVLDPGIGAFGTERDLNGPRSMVFDRDGTLLVADSSNHRIARIDLETGAITGVAGEFRRAGYRDGKRPLFNLPEGLALGPDGTLYVSEYGNNTVRQLDLTTGRVRTLAGRRGRGGHADGAGRRARFDAPSSLVYHDGSLFVAESYGLVIRRVDVATGEVTTLAGAYERGGAADGVGDAARFGHHESSALGEMPYGMAFANGSLFLADSGNHVVRRIEPATGTVSTVAGRAVDDAMPAPRALAYADGALYATAGQGLYRVAPRPALIAGDSEKMGHDDGIAGAARFRGPVALASLSDGNLVVGEINGQVRLVDPARGDVRTLVDFERILDAIVVDARDRIYVASLFEIDRVDPDGSRSVVVARSGKDHPEAVIVPDLYEPMAMALDGQLLYVLDGHRLYSGYPGMITTLRRIDLAAGRSDALVTWFDRKAGLAMRGPRGLALAPDHSLWIAHTGGALIRFDPDAGEELEVLAGATTARGVTLGRAPALNHPSTPIVSPDGELLFVDEGAVLETRGARWSSR